MFSLLLIFVSVAAVLPTCLSSSPQPLIWASVEAQAEYRLTDDGIGGTKCSGEPKTFEIRADGSWLPASEFDLTGNFDDDCGIHVTLSIPEEYLTSEKLVDGLPQKQLDELREKKVKLESDRKDLLEEVKKFPSVEKALADEMEEHENKIEQLRKEKVALEEKKAEYTKKSTDAENQKKRKDVIDSRLGDLTERKKKLTEVQYNDAEKIDKEETEVVQNKTRTSLDISKFKKLYDYDCVKLSDQDYFIIWDKVTIPDGHDIYICSTKAWNIEDKINSLWEAEKGKWEGKRKDLQEEVNKFTSGDEALMNEIREHENKMESLRKEKMILKAKEVDYSKKSSEVDVQNKRKEAIDIRRGKLIERKEKIRKDLDFDIFALAKDEENVKKEIEEKKAKKIRLERLLKGACEGISDNDYFVIGFDPNIPAQKYVHLCTPYEPDSGDVNN